MRFSDEADSTTALTDLNSRTLNNDRPGHSLLETLDLAGDRYNFVVAMFFIPYVLFEFPSNIA